MPLALQSFALISVDCELAVPVDLRKLGFDRSSASSTSRDFDHDFGDAVNRPPDLLELGATELEGRVTPAPPIGHQVQPGRLAAAGWTKAQARFLGWANRSLQPLAISLVPNFLVSGCRAL